MQFPCGAASFITTIDTKNKTLIKPGNVDQMLCS